jgi:hypothetical protein
VLLAYCGVVVLFGFVYWFAWRSRPTAFVFTSSLPVNEHIVALEDRILRLERHIAADRALEEAPTVAEDATTRALIEAEVDSLAGLSSRLRSRLVSTLSPMDFIYFSFITMTTLGYGDIVPNSTFVRGLVVLEAMLGIFLLVVVVNDVLQAYKQYEEEKEPAATAGKQADEDGQET